MLHISANLVSPKKISLLINHSYTHSTSHTNLNVVFPRAHWKALANTVNESHTVNFSKGALLPFRHVFQLKQHSNSTSHYPNDHESQTKLKQESINFEMFSCSQSRLVPAEPQYTKAPPQQYNARQQQIRPLPPSPNPQQQFSKPQRAKKPVAQV